MNFVTKEPINKGWSSDKKYCVTDENGTRYLLRVSDIAQRLVRNKSENRLLHKESKRNLEWSEAEMRKTSEKYQLNSYDGESLPFENYIKIDNTTLAPDEVAKMIQTHFAIEGRKE